MVLVDGGGTPIGLYVDSASPSEMKLALPTVKTIKVAGGKLRLEAPTVQWFLGLAERYALREIPLDARLVCAAAALPLIHRDPFDRVLVALARADALTVLTSDEHIPKYPGVKALW